MMAVVHFKPREAIDRATILKPYMTRPSPTITLSPFHLVGMLTLAMAATKRRMKTDNGVEKRKK